MSTKKIKSLLILLASLIACSGIFGAYTYADDINKAQVLSSLKNDKPPSE